MSSNPQAQPRPLPSLTLVPLEFPRGVEAGEAAAQRAVPAPGAPLLCAWPAPPCSDWATGALSGAPERAVVELASGDRLAGAVIDVDLAERKLRLRPDGKGPEREIGFEALGTVLLTRTLDLARPAVAAKWGATLRRYTVHDPEGERLQGETAGEVRDERGLFLFPSTQPGRVQRLFIPAARVHRYESVARQAVKLSLDDLALPELPAAPEAIGAASLAPPARTARLTTPAEVRAALAAAGKSPLRRIGDVLLEAGLVDAAKIEAALAVQKTRPRKLLGEVLIEMGAVRADQMRTLLTQKLGIPAIDPTRFAVEDAALARVPHAVCMRHKLMPLFVDGESIVVAMDNPLSGEALEAVRFATGGAKVVPALASWPEMRTVLSSRNRVGFWPGGADGEASAFTLPADKTGPAMPSADGGYEFDLSGVEELTSRLTQELVHRDAEEVESVRESDSTLVRLVNKIIIDAHESGASDIHIEPAPGKRPARIRVRRDGILADYAEVPAKFRSALVSRIKIMANLDISERRKPQDGKIDFAKFGPLRLELRVATIPTNNGLESVILRLLAAHEAVPPEKLGLEEHVLAQLKALTTRPHGLLLVCGPTGSGKTTTLHSLISMINTPERKIWTAEDPVEITQEGLCQVQVNPKIGWTFADALRAFLRADPDVIMVGEMRDAETASMGVEASLTGHLVMSTLHTNSAPETVTRLLDLGVDPFNFGDALLGVLAQRLARRVCPGCATKVALSDDEAGRLATEYCHDTPLDPHAVMQDWMARHAQGGRLWLAHGRGCEACAGSGLKGRLGLHEFMASSPSLRALIQSRTPVEQLRARAVSEGMRTLKQDGIEKALRGLLPMEQVRAVCN